MLIKPEDIKPGMVIGVVRGEYTDVRLVIAVKKGSPIWYTHLDLDGTAYGLLTGPMVSATETKIKIFRGKKRRALLKKFKKAVAQNLSSVGRLMDIVKLIQSLGD